MWNTRSALSRCWPALAWLAPLFIVSCTSEKIVFRDREPFNPPPDATNNFLGYFTASTKQTTCGNCHVGHQADWVQTAHADAYALPAGSSDATDECFTCHAVTDRGNAVAGPAGWDKVQDVVYHDVQCENCHGPGLDHVTAPDAPPSANNPPLAHVGVLGPSALGDSVSVAQSCGNCHNQNSGPGVRAFEEWAASGHAHTVREGSANSPANNPSCVSCHEGKGVLAAWGVTANYAEKSLTGSENNLAQTCAVCHDPHGSAIDPVTGQPVTGQLRFPISTPDVNQNLCMKCHQRRSQPDPASSFGPHSPQGPMLLGDAGYQPAGFDPDLQAVATSHGSEKNPRLCAGCHVNRLAGTDVTTGKPAISAGHLFLAIPCLDAGGLPVKEECARDEPSRSWAACTASGCHASATVAVSLIGLSAQRMDQLTKAIWDDLNANRQIDPNPDACAALALTCDPGTTDAGLLSNTHIIETSGAGNQYVLNDATITPAEGARFNVNMLRTGGVDGSSGVHNPFLGEALLRANIDELQDTYPGLPAVAAVVQNIMNGPLGAVTQRPLSRPLISRQVSSR